MNPIVQTEQSPQMVQPPDGNGKYPWNQTQARIKKANSVVKRWDILNSEAINWLTHWQHCYENIVPRKEDVLSVRMPGDRRNSELFDTTAILANEMLASALHGFLTNPETKFFEITFGDPTLDNDEEVKGWCQDVGDRMFRVINNTNFQTEIYEIYIDLGAAGTACLFMGEHEENVVHFSARALKEVRVDENSLGLIDVVYRLFKWRAHQIIEEFGRDNVSEDILKADKNADQTQFEVVHAVQPYPFGEKSPKGHLFESVYVLKESKFVLSEDGFREFPYAVPRWSKTTGEKYGRGPGMSTLPDILMANAMMQTVIQGAQKTVDPPLMVPDDGVIGNVRLTPGGLTIVRPGEQNQIRPLITDARIDFGQKMVEDVRGRIRAGFYVDQFQMQEGPQKTAEEVRQSTEDKLRLMGPVLGRQHFELLKPVIHRLYGIMNRKKLLPKAPVKIQGKNWEVRYSSTIARAQRMSEGQNIMRAMQMLAPLAQMAPQILDNINKDKIVHEVWDIYGCKHDLLLSKRDLDTMRQQIAAQKQKMEQQQAELHQSQVAKNAAPAISAASQAQQAQSQQQGGG